MKHLILYFICSTSALASEAKDYDKCMTEVSRIRNTPAKLISDSDYGKMLKGCGQPPKFISDNEMEIIKLREENAYYKRAYDALATALGRCAVRAGSTR